MQRMLALNDIEQILAYAPVPPTHNHQTSHLTTHQILSEIFCTKLSAINLFVLQVLC